MQAKFDKAVIIFSLILLLLLYITIFPSTKLSKKQPGVKVWKIVIIEQVIEEQENHTADKSRIINYYENWYKPNHHSTKTITQTDIEYEYIGYYYCTAYSPQETGSWVTASGTTLHRADYENRLIEPTTCAVDRSLHRFGDLFYIPAFDRVFIAEDTGSAVRGNHLDLGYTDLESVWSFPTGTYETYSVEYIYIDIELNCYDFPKEKGIIQKIWRHENGDSINN